MNNQGAGHLEEGDLLRLIDGELPESAIPAAREHIEACWSCRAQFQEIEMAIGEYVRYQKATDPLLPPPPNAWPELRLRAGAADRQTESPRLRMMPSRRFDLRWAVAAAAVLIAVLIGYRFDRVPAVSAAGLLRSASGVEPENGSIQIKTTSGTMVRPAVLEKPAGGDDARLREIFERAHFNWKQPLSARSFAAWRDQLAEKEDEVRLEKNRLFGDAYVIRTSTRSSELHRATMTLRARDLRPVHEMLEFTGETVELEQAPEPAAAPPARIAAAPARAAKAEVSPEATLHRMLQVFSTLHGLGADLGEPVEIRQSAGTVEVVATGLTAARQQHLRAALGGIPSVTVRFDEGTPRVTPQREAATNPARSTSPGQTRLQALLGSAQAAEDFTDRALDASDAVLARVHALRALAKAFPPAQEAAMSTADRQLLEAIRKDHAAALTGRIGDLRRALQPVTGNVPQEPAGTVEVPDTWQEAAERLFLAAQQLDESLNRELAGEAAIGSGFGPIANSLNGLDREAAIFTRR